MKNLEYKNNEYVFALKCLSAAIETINVEHSLVAPALLTAAEMAFTRPCRLEVGDLVELNEKADLPMRGTGIIVGYDEASKDYQVFWFKQVMSTRPGWLSFKCSGEAETRQSYQPTKGLYTAALA